MPTLTTSWQAVASRSVYVTSNTTGYNILYARYANIDYNTDRVYWESRFYAYNQYGSYTAWGRTVNDAWSCSFNGQYQSGSKQQGTIYSSSTPVGSISINNTYAYTSGYFDVDHTSAWTGTMSYTGYCFQSNGTLSANLSLNALFTPSAPSLASTAYIGDSVTINTNRMLSNYKHTLSYSLDNTNFTQIATNVDTSVNWVVPTSFYTSIPNSKQITFYIRCVTTDGTNSGTRTISAIAYVKESVSKPTISSITYENDDVTESVAGDGYVIGNFSSVSVSFTATALNSANVNQVFLWTGTTSSPTKITTAQGSGTTYNATLTYNATTYPVYIGVTDSRGFTYYDTNTTIPSSSSFYKDYVVLSVDSAPTIKRDSQTSSDVTIQSFTGNFWANRFNSSTLNELTIEFRYKEISSENWSSNYLIPSSYVTIDSQNNTYTISNYTFSNGTSEIPFNYQKAYYVQIIATDLLQSQSYQATIPVGIPAFAIFQDTIKIKGNPLLDLIYPVGSIYTYNSSTNPSSILGGTWEQVECHELIQSGTLSGTNLNRGYYRLYANGDFEAWGESNRLAQFPLGSTYYLTANLPFTPTTWVIVPSFGQCGDWAKCFVMAYYGNKYIGVNTWNDSGVTKTNIVSNFICKGTTNLATNNIATLYSWKRIS